MSLMPSLIPNLSEENQQLLSENRRMKERLFELYSQINSLTKISDDNDIQIPNKSSLQTTTRRSSSVVSLCNFKKSESIILPGGAIYSAALSPSSSHVALASLSGTLSILTTSLKSSIAIPAHTLSCRDVFWGSVGLVSCGFDKAVRLWDSTTGTLQRETLTDGLVNSVCGSEEDSSSIFAASGSSIIWIDKRRQTPITIGADSTTTSVSIFNDLIIFGGYDGLLSIVDRRSLHAGKVQSIRLKGGAVSSISKVLPSGECIVITVSGQPVLVELTRANAVNQLPFEAPMRFGCRGDITEQNLIFSNKFATICGGRMAGLCDGFESPILFEEVSGFDYGAIFLTSIAQKVLSFSEDGVVNIWSLRHGLG